MSNPAKTVHTSIVWRRAGKSCQRYFVLTWIRKNASVLKTFQWKGAHYYCNSIIITDILLHRCFVCHITTGRMSYRQQVSSSIFIKLGKYVFLGFKSDPLDALLICKRFIRQLVYTWALRRSKQYLLKLVGMNISLSIVWIQLKSIINLFLLLEIYLCFYILVRVLL